MTISVGNLIVAGGATVDTSEVLSALNKQGLKVWVGTTSQRDALPENVKNDDKITFLTYDSEEDIYLIVDTIISYSKTWSSVKISTELAKKINSSDVYTKTEVMSLINSKVASALKYRGAVATVAALPSSGQENGDSYYVQADGYMYAWSSDYSDWQALGSATDMTNYYTKTEVDALLADMAVKFQYNVMPTADSTTVGKIIQYTGADTNDYKNGYWYKGVDNGDSTYSWTVENYNKSAIDDLISSNVLDNNYYGGFMAGTVAWYKTGDLFDYPGAGGFWSSTFLLSDRNGAWTGILKVADNGAGTVSATITSLGSNPLGGEEFYYNSVSRCLYFCGTWDRLTITQLTGAKVDLSITSTTQEEAKQNTQIVPTKLATTTLPTLNGTCKGLADSECYATFDVTFDSWGGSSPVIIGIAVDGAYVNSKALIMVNNSIDSASDKKVRILYADGVNCLFRVFAVKSSLYSNTVTVYVSFYTSEAQYDYSFKVQQRDYIGAISNLNVTNDSAGMPVSSWFQSVAQPSAPVLTSELQRFGVLQQISFNNTDSVTINMVSTAYRLVTIYNYSDMYRFMVHEWGAECRYKWIVGSALPTSITTSYNGSTLTITNNGWSASGRIVVEGPSDSLVIS